LPGKKTYCKLGKRRKKNTSLSPNRTKINDRKVSGFPGLTVQRGGVGKNKIKKRNRTETLRKQKATGDYKTWRSGIAKPGVMGGSGAEEKELKAEPHSANPRHIKQCPWPKTKKPVRKTGGLTGGKSRKCKNDQKANSIGRVRPDRAAGKRGWSKALGKKDFAKSAPNCQKR